ncbi:hydrolase [Candidatus Saccharibacteria bacterium CG10_big_fil_rev_8_21_14_0_10_47_8]|nr:MAG: hydrolase [Candidatus Saccharibacteria bacterium CG10_big_fil_rev_8_21_14_0_10_47_8]
MISALLFDLDGTLFDSTKANVKAYSQAFEKAGVVFSADKYRQLFGLRFGEMMEQIAPNTDPHVVEKIKNLKSEFYKENLEQVKPNVGLLNFLRDAKAHYKTALVTTASAKNVDSLLSHFLSGENLFDVIIRSEDVAKSKPDPECYKLAAERLGVDPSECLVFEDTKIGIDAAAAAGMAYIRVTL